jgi:G:T-mismatch repair DNA endonuclease (very short patch repair protein)
MNMPNRRDAAIDVKTTVVPCRALKSNSKYWLEKVSSNQARDKRHQKALYEAGWRTLTIWECEVKNPKLLNLLLSKVQRLEPVLPSRSVRHIHHGGTALEGQKEN